MDKEIMNNAIPDDELEMVNGGQNSVSGNGLGTGGARIKGSSTIKSSTVKSSSDSLTTINMFCPNCNEYRDFGVFSAGRCVCPECSYQIIK